MAAQYLDKAKQSLAALPEAPETILLAQALEGMANREK
jgi:geranylgeranyl pyrophosphate synthase